MMTRRAPRAFFGSLALLSALLWVGPYAWMVLTSLKSLKDIVSRPDGILPEHPTLGAYRELFATLPVGRTLLLTVAMATLIAMLQIVLALPAG